jgi:hypothetical protein
LPQGLSQFHPRKEASRRERDAMGRLKARKSQKKLPDAA